MAFTDLLAAICIFVNAVKGLSALQFSRDLCVQYKTAWVLAHKLREALAAETAFETLDGEVEIDGAYFGGHVRPENRKEDRKDRRLKKNQSDKRRVVVALRERDGRTLTFVRETEAEGVQIAKDHIDADAIVKRCQAALQCADHTRGSPGRVPVYPHDGTERLKPEWICQASKEFVSTTVLNDRFSDNRSETGHPVAKPSGTLPP